MTTVTNYKNVSFHVITYKQRMQKQNAVNKVAIKSCTKKNPYWLIEN